MSWQKGFMRLWLLLSVIWFTGCLLVNGTVQKAYTFASSDYLSIKFTAEDVRIESDEGGIATATVEDERNSWIGKNWWMDNPRILEIDTSNVSPNMPNEWNKVLDAVALKFNQDAAIHNARIKKQSVEILQESAIAVGFPLFLLLAGSAIGWVLAGFRRRP